MIYEKFFRKQPSPAVRRALHIKNKQRALKIKRKMLTEVHIKMGKRAEKALMNHMSGYNCAQAVACAFSDVMGMDEKDVFRLAEGFGFGMGSKQVCGAISGMQMAASCLSSDGDLDDPKTKAKTYKLMRELQQQFIDKNQSIICGELLGGPGKPKLRSCPGCVEDAANILEKYMEENVK